MATSCNVLAFGRLIHDNAPFFLALECAAALAIELKGACMDRSTQFLATLLAVGAIAFEVGITKGADKQADKPPTVEQELQPVTLKVLDASGKPVKGAKVGRFVYWEAKKEPRVYGIGESGEPDLTDESGQVRLDGKALADSIYRDSLAICAIDTEQRQIGLISLAKKDFGATKELRLSPPVKVEFNIHSSQLEKLNQPFDRGLCYIYWEDSRPFFSDSKNGQLTFWLPPGKYRYNAYGSTLVENKDDDFELTSGDQAKSFDVDLAASPLASLIGHPAPEPVDIKGWKNTDGLRLANLRGKVVVLEFWGHWCGPCVHSMPELMKLYDEFHDQGLEVVAIHDDTVDSVEDMEKKLEDVKKELWNGRDLPFPVAVDGGKDEQDRKKSHGATTALYGIHAFPTAILVGRDGNVVGELAYRGKEGRSELVAALTGKPADGDQSSQEHPTPPETDKRPVTDTYHGVKVTEDYRWLEESDDPAVKAWSEAENAYARSILDKLPGREAIQKRVSEIMSAELVSYFDFDYRGGKFFAMKEQPPKQQPFLIVSDSATDLSGERVLSDPNADKTGHAAITWYRPSFDGKYVAVSIAHGGAEVGDVTVYDTATGKATDDNVPRVNTGTAGGDLAWAADGSGFYYTRHPREGEKPVEDMNFYQKIYFHKLGTPTSEDRFELGEDFPRIAEGEIQVDKRTGRVLVTVQNGDGGEFAHYLKGKDGKWRKFTNFKDKIIQANFGPGDDLFVVSRQDAPRGKILRVPINTLDVAHGKVIVPEGEDAIVTAFTHDTTVAVTDSRLYVVYQLGGPSEVRAFDLEGKPQTAPKQLPVSAVGHLVELEGDDLLYANASYTQPMAAYWFHAKAGDVQKTALKLNEPVNLDDAEVVREFATSKDGTKVPVNIIFRKGTDKSGKNPALLTGYGGYGVNIQPGFRALNRVLLDHGFVVAIANIRGGGEYGEQWHRQGNLTKKQNVFDDFAAAMDHLVKAKYTSRDKLAIIGGSNGGLLMGAELTQHPDMMKCVISMVGIYDMLRVELSANGEFNITEFGTVKDEAQFKALFAYSPYHHVKEGVKYPATLLMTGENDPRVEPMQSRKMVARLQAASPDGGPFLLRTSADTGHGSETPLSERIAQQVDVFAFLFDQLGVEF
jgi:prolyl oligopeptidase